NNIKDGTLVSMKDVDTLDALSSTPSNEADRFADLSWSCSQTGACVGPTTSTVSPTTATKFSVTAKTGGTELASVVIGVTPDARASAAVVEIGASPMIAAPGSTVTLSWAATDESPVSITPPPPADPRFALPYGPHGRIPVKLPATPGPYTYKIQSA